MGKLVVESLQKRIKIKKLENAVYKTLLQTDNLKAELVFSDSENMRNLNKNARGVDKVTDVLSFPSLDGIKGKILKREDCKTEMDGKYIFIGSIVLCEEKIKDQAKELEHSEEEERNYLIIHGLMHLMGYDHMTDEDKKEMRQKEKEAVFIMTEKERKKAERLALKENKKALKKANVK